MDVLGMDQHLCIPHDSDSSVEPEMDVLGMDPNLCIPYINETCSQSAELSDRAWKLQALLHMRQNHSMTFDGLSQFDMYLEEYSARKVDALKVQFLSQLIVNPRKHNRV